ncbi:hypothetical protein BX600DRAFT_508061 [Xylariales sp. PMI_506]|nr:hypothetical protein BX600DRAFT_508061 [Xylariales sp. PMI_506]
MANTAEDPWAIELISANEDGYRFFLTEYKAFRLTALQQDPEEADMVPAKNNVARNLNIAFGSTYAREVEFTEEDWRKRLSSPLAKTFVVVRLADSRILSAVTITGLMDLVLDPTSGQGQGLRSSPSSAAGASSSYYYYSSSLTLPSLSPSPLPSPSPLRFRVNGVYTRAEARGRRLGVAVMNAALQSAEDEAQRQGRGCNVDVDVFATNLVARAFYEKCGFVLGGPRPKVLAAATTTVEESLPEILSYRYESTAQVRIGAGDLLTCV